MLALRVGIIRVARCGQMRQETILPRYVKRRCCLEYRTTTQPTSLVASQAVVPSRVHVAFPCMLFTTALSLLEVGPER